MPRTLFLNSSQTVEIPDEEKTYLFTLGTENAQAELLIDIINKRLRVLKIMGNKEESILEKIYEVAKLNKLGKIWAVATIDQWEWFFKWGYILEGILPRYFDSGSAYYMAYFLSSERRISTLIDEEERLINNLKKQNLAGKIPALPEGYEMRLGNFEDVEELAKFYDEIFPTYPTPMHDPKYVKKMMNNKVIFNIIFWKGKIVTAASADIEEASKTVEMTDIACSPEHRGKQLPVIAINSLEKKMKQLKMKTLYTLARAKLPGINKAFYRLGYSYYGRLINNCDIFDGYEDMNLLVKVL
jgi:putative beta-lysine N-acetyltransferase